MIFDELKKAMQEYLKQKEKHGEKMSYVANNYIEVKINNKKKRKSKK